MKLPKLALFAALLSPFVLSPAFAQRGGGHGGGGFHGGGGVHVGGGVHGGFGGGVRGGYYGGGRYFYGARPYWGPSFYFGLGGWGYPYYGSYGYDPYYYSYDPYAYGYPVDPGPSVTIQNGYPQGQAMPVPQQPQAQSQQAPPQPAGVNQGEGGFYLIAFNDHTIQAATAYKVEGGQIHWITREGQEKQAPLSSVDVHFSQQINRDRHVEFHIP